MEADRAGPVDDRDEAAAAVLVELFEIVVPMAAGGADAAEAATADLVAPLIGPGIMSSPMDNGARFSKSFARAS